MVEQTAQHRRDVGRNRNDKPWITLDINGRASIPLLDFKLLNCDRFIRSANSKLLGREDSSFWGLMIPNVQKRVAVGSDPVATRIFDVHSLPKCHWLLLNMRWSCTLELRSLINSSQLL